MGKETKSPGSGYVKMVPGLGKVTIASGFGKLMKNALLGKLIKNAWSGKGNMTSGPEILKYNPYNWHIPLFFFDDSHPEYIHQVSGKDKLYLYKHSQVPCAGVGKLRSSRWLRQSHTPKAR